MEAAEQQFLTSVGVFVGTAKHLGTEERDQLMIEAMSAEVLTTAEIEGEILGRASSSPPSVGGWDSAQTFVGCDRLGRGSRSVAL